MLVRTIFATKGFDFKTSDICPVSHWIENLLLLMSLAKGKLTLSKFCCKFSSSLQNESLQELSPIIRNLFAKKNWVPWISIYLKYCINILRMFLWPLLGYDNYIFLKCYCRFFNQNSSDLDASGLRTSHFISYRFELPEDCSQSKYSFNSWSSRHRFVFFFRIFDFFWEIWLSIFRSGR